MIFLVGLTQERRFFNELAMAGLANPVDQWVGAKCDIVLLNIAPSDKNINLILFCVSDIPRNKQVSGSIKNQRKAKQSTSVF